MNCCLIGDGANPNKDYCISESDTKHEVDQTKLLEQSNLQVGEK